MVVNRSSSKLFNDTNFLKHLDGTASSVIRSAIIDSATSRGHGSEKV